MLDPLSSSHSDHPPCCGVVHSFLDHLLKFLTHFQSSLPENHPDLHKFLERINADLNKSFTFFDLNRTDMDSLKAHFTKNVDILSTVLSEFQDYLNGYVHSIPFTSDIREDCIYYIFEISRFLRWAKDATYRRVLLEAEKLRIQYGLTKQIPEYPLPAELIVLGEAGHGTFSDVFYALMPNNGRFPLVALKRLTLTEPARRRYNIGDTKNEVVKAILKMKMQELTLLRLLTNCDHIVTLAVDDPRLPFDTIVLEPAGFTLRDVMNKVEHGLPMWLLAGLGLELFMGLLEIHEHGIIHGDIKPSNVLINGNYEKLVNAAKKDTPEPVALLLKISDFGSAVFASGIPAGYIPYCGIYRAPELVQVANKRNPFTAAVDVFAAGAMKLGAVLRDEEGKPMLSTEKALWEQLEEATGRVECAELPEGATEALCTLLNNHIEVTLGENRDAGLLKRHTNVTGLVYTKLMEGVERARAADTELEPTLGSYAAPKPAIRPPGGRGLGTDPRTVLSTPLPTKRQRPVKTAPGWDATRAPGDASAEIPPPSAVTSPPTTPELGRHERHPPLTPANCGSFAPGANSTGSPPDQVTAGPAIYSGPAQRADPAPPAPPPRDSHCTPSGPSALSLASSYFISTATALGGLYDDVGCERAAEDDSRKESGQTKLRKFRAWLESLGAMPPTAAPAAAAAALTGLAGRGTKKAKKKKQKGGAAATEADAGERLDPFAWVAARFAAMLVLCVLPDKAQRLTVPEAIVCLYTFVQELREAAEEEGLMAEAGAGAGAEEGAAAAASSGKGAADVPEPGRPRFGMPAGISGRGDPRFGRQRYYTAHLDEPHLVQIPLTTEAVDGLLAELRTKSEKLLVATFSDEATIPRPFHPVGEDEIGGDMLQESLSEMKPAILAKLIARAARGESLAAENFTESTLANIVWTLLEQHGLIAIGEAPSSGLTKREIPRSDLAYMLNTWIVAMEMKLVPDGLLDTLMFLSEADRAEFLLWPFLQSTRRRYFDTYSFANYILFVAVALDRCFIHVGMQFGMKVTHTREVAAGVPSAAGCTSGYTRGGTGSGGGMKLRGVGDAPPRVDQRTAGSNDSPLVVDADSDSDSDEASDDCTPPSTAPRSPTASEDARRVEFAEFVALLGPARVYSAPLSHAYGRPVKRALPGDGVVQDPNWSHLCPADQVVGASVYAPSADAGVATGDVGSCTVEQIRQAVDQKLPYPGLYLRNGKSGPSLDATPPTWAESMRPLAKLGFLLIVILLYPHKLCGSDSGLLLVAQTLLLLQRDAALLVVSDELTNMLEALEQPLALRCGTTRLCLGMAYAVLFCQEAIKPNAKKRGKFEILSAMMLSLFPLCSNRKLQPISTILESCPLPARGWTSVKYLQQDPPAIVRFVQDMRGYWLELVGDAPYGLMAVGDGKLVEISRSCPKQPLLSFFHTAGGEKEDGQVSAYFDSHPTLKFRRIVRTNRRSIDAATLEKLRQQHEQERQKERSGTLWDDVFETTDSGVANMQSLIMQQANSNEVVGRTLREADIERQRLFWYFSSASRPAPESSSAIVDIGNAVAEAVNTTQQSPRLTRTALITAPNTTARSRHARHLGFDGAGGSPDRSDDVLQSQPSAASSAPLISDDSAPFSDWAAADSLRDMSVADLLQDEAAVTSSCLNDGVWSSLLPSDPAGFDWSSLGTAACPAASSSSSSFTQPPLSDTVEWPSASVAAAQHLPASQWVLAMFDLLLDTYHSLSSPS